MELCLMYDNRSMIRVTWCCTKTSVPKFCPLAKNKRIEIIFSFYSIVLRFSRRHLQIGQQLTLGYLKSECLLVECRMK
jgi:hypothetical protein